MWLSLEVSWTMPCQVYVSCSLTAASSSTAGPAGMMASLCCNTYGLKVLHIDERDAPTTAGRADGIQPRTIEVSLHLFFLSF